MRSVAAIIIVLALAGVAGAADPAGPFAVSRRTFRAGDAATVARDGTIESATLAEGGAAAGRIAIRAWSGDTQLGTRSIGGANLFLTPGVDASIGLATGWNLREGSDSVGTWTYGTKFQQDALLVMGFADADRTAIPTGDGAGFALEGVQAYDRVMLVLPWRWVQGGGSSWQRTAFAGGNPPEAGVWAVPAGASLAQVAANAASYRLAGLDGILGEIQPHLVTTAFRLRLLPGGGWQVVVDIDDDGAADLVADATQAGHRPSPFSAMTERSGLIVSLRAAMGSGSGLVGRTDAELTYRIGATTVPSAVDRRPLVARIPLTSRVSPATVDGLAWNAARAVTVEAATLPSGEQPVARLGDRQFYAEVPLRASGPVAVTVRQAGTPATVVADGIFWVPVQLYREERIAIRRGDRLLLAFDASCGSGAAVDVDADGDGTIDAAGLAADGALEWRYGIAGTFHPAAFRAGVRIGGATVEVADVHLPAQIAAQVGFAREIDIATGAIPAANVIARAADATLLSVSVVSRGADRMRVSVKPLRRGTPVLELRLGDAQGPLLARREITEFTLDTGEAQHVVFDAADGHGTAELRMRPHVPGLDLSLTMFASRAAFAPGLRDIAVRTDDLAIETGVEGEPVGVLSYDILVPAGENAFCYAVALTQDDPIDGASEPESAIPDDVVGDGAYHAEGDQPVAVGATRKKVGGTSVNGHGCKILIDPITLCVGDPAVALVARHAPDSRREGAGTLTIDKGKRPKPVRFTDGTFAGPIDCTKDVPFSKDVVAAADTTRGVYHVKVGKTLVKNRIVVVDQNGVSLEQEQDRVALCFDYSLRARLCRDATATDYHFEIRFASQQQWHTLQRGASSSFTGTARAAGRFMLRVTATVGGVDRISEEEEMIVEFPTCGEIRADADVVTMCTAAGKETEQFSINDAEHRVREQGFYITLDTATCRYGKTDTVFGTPEPAGAAGEVRLALPVPPDQPAAPTPLGPAVYVVATFHTHPPTAFAPIVEGAPRQIRNVGPSGDDRRNDAERKLAGLVSDYVEDKPGSRLIPAGHPVDAPRTLYCTRGDGTRRPLE